MDVTHLLLPLGLVLALVVRFWWTHWRFRWHRPSRYPYTRRDRLLTHAETRFFRALTEAVGSRYLIAVSVRLADVLSCPRSLWGEYGSLIASKQLDFVLCDPTTTAIALALELDDATHRRPSRKARDRFLDKAMAAAGLPLLRFNVSASYDAGEIAKTIAEATGSHRTARELA